MSSRSRMVIRGGNQLKWVKRDEASASNIRQFPARRPSTEPDFDSNAWAEGLVVSP